MGNNYTPWPYLIYSYSYSFLKSVINWQPLAHQIQLIYFELYSSSPVKHWCSSHAIFSIALVLLVPVFVLSLVPVVIANKLVNPKVKSLIATSTVLAVLHFGVRSGIGVPHVALKRKRAYYKDDHW